MSMAPIAAQDPDRAAEVAAGWLREQGPATAEDLRTRLTAAGCTPEVAEEAVEALPEYGAWHLGNDLLVHGPTVIEGTVFTHLLTDAEAEHGVILDEEDIGLLLSDLVRDETRPLSAGGGFGLRWKSGAGDVPLDTVDAYVAGPEGWLGGCSAGELVAFAVRGGSVEISPAVPEDHPELTTWFLDAYERQKMRDGTAFVAYLALDVLVHHPEAFSMPRLPVTDLVAAAGLSREGDSVAPGGFDWGALWEQRRDEAGQRRAEEYGLDELDGRLLDALAVASVLLVGADSAQALDPELLERAATAFTSPAACDAFMDRPLIGGVHDEQLAAARLLAQAVLDRDPAHPPAGAWWVLGRCAEFDRDFASHEAAVAAALRTDAEFWPALEDAAMYASDRGDAARALALLSQSGQGDPMLEHYARPGPVRAGRNEPCPCGSGRKWKACCGRHNGHPLADRADWLLEKLRDFARRPPQGIWLLPLARAVEAAAAHPDDAALRSALARRDVALVDLLLFEGGVIEQFLETRGDLLPRDELELLFEWITERHRVARVRGVTARGLQLEEPGIGVAFTIALGRAERPDPLPQPGDMVLVLELADAAHGSFGVVHRLAAEVAGEVADLLADERDLELVAPLVVGPAIDRHIARLRHPKPAEDERAERLAWCFPAVTGLPDPDDEASIGELVEAEHPFPLLDHPDAEERHRLHLALHEIVVRHILDDTPPEVWATAQRLRRGGVDHHELLHELMSAVAPDVLAALKGGPQGGDEAYALRLASLSPPRGSRHVTSRHRRRGR